MSHTHASGTNFVHSIVRNSDELQQEVQTLRENVSCLRLELEKERHFRETAIEQVLGQAASKEITVSPEALANARKKNLGPHSDSLDTGASDWPELPASIHAALAKLQHVQAGTNDRLSRLEGKTPRLNGAVDLEKLALDVASLQECAARDRASAAASIESFSSRLSRELLEDRARLDALQSELLHAKLEVSKSAPASELAAVSSKLENVHAEVKMRASTSDHQALDSRTRNLERSVDAFLEDVKRKAFDTDVQVVSNKVQDMSAEMASFHNQTRVDFEGTLSRMQELKDRIESMELRCRRDLEHSLIPLSGRIDSVSASLKILERRHDADQERHSACWVALEKEITTKAAKTEMSAQGIRIQAAEDALAPLEQSIATKASLSDLHGMITRLQALEDGFVDKADAAELQKTSLSLSSQISRVDELCFRSHEHANQLKELEKHSMEHKSRLEELDCSTADIQKVLPHKALAVDVYSKSDIDRHLSSFYPRLWIDDQLDQLWWRVGQHGKGKNAIEVTRKV